MKKTLHVFAIACISLLALPAAAQIPAYVPTDGLVGWWPFNGNANDESGNGNDGVVNGATLTEDRNGIENTSYYFDGSGVNITCDLVTSINPIQNSGISLSAWVTNDLDEDELILSLGNNAPPYGGYAIWNSTAVGITSGAGYYGESPNIQINFPSLSGGADEWTLLTSTFNMTSGEAKLYLNGELIGISQGEIIPEVMNLLRVGRPVPGLDWYRSGKIDDIAIYNRALTQEEITALYNGEPVSPPATCNPLPSNLQQGLVGYWPFCGNANDESGNGNDGTVNGATLTEDRFGNAESAYSFDGSDDIINYSTLDSVDMNSFNGITMSGWMNTTSLSLNQRMVHFYNNQIDISIHYSADLQRLTFVNYNLELGENFRHEIEILPNQWIYTVWSLDFTNNISQAFIDGQLIAEQNSIPIQFGDDMALGVGNGPTLENWPFSGSLDDIGIWNRALTPEEVQELYTLDACTFTVYDTTYVTVYDTLTTYETVYDTLYTYETIYDTVTTYVTVTDTLLIDITFTGIEGQPSWLNTVTVFPNPASDHITIDYGNFALMAGYNTVITDAAGATVYSSAVNSQQAYIDINGWGAAGVYYLTIYDASGAAVAVRHIVLE
jgi:hypothetical protein